MSALRESLESLVKARKRLHELEGRLQNPTQHGYAYLGFEDLVLQRGHEYVSVPLTTDEWKVLEAAAKIVLRALHKRDFPLKACWGNSQARANRSASGVWGGCRGGIFRRTD